MAEPRQHTIKIRVNKNVNTNHGTRADFCTGEDYLTDQNLSVRYINNEATCDEFRSRGGDDSDEGAEAAPTEDFNNNKAADFNLNMADTKSNIKTAEFRVSPTESKSNVAGEDMKRASGGDRRRQSSSASRRTPGAIFENSYKLEPSADQFFQWSKVRNLIYSLVGPLFSAFKYESKSAGNLCRTIGNKIPLMIRKKFDWPRYRYVCHVTLAQQRKQSLIVADRSLWYAPTDSCAVCTFLNNDAVMVVTLHGIYFE